jgi:putative ABC transport system substrate-binding protein
MKRREFITLLGGACAGWPFAARAQRPEPMRRVGALMNLAADDPESQDRIGAFLQQLAKLGWTVGRNLRIDYRWPAGDDALTRRYAAELVELAPHVILAASGATVLPLLQATRTIPIVLRRPPIRSVPALSQAWRGRAATPRASPNSNSGQARNGWSCSSRFPQM